MADRKLTRPGERSGAGSGSAMQHLGDDAQRSSDGARRERRKGHLVLVVDDEPASRYATARVLQDAGFSTRETGSGYEAVTLAETAVAVVLDVNLPDVNGVKVCNILKSQPATRSLPVLLHSAVYDDDLHREAGLAAGADVYLSAPLRHEEMIAALDQLLPLA